MENEVTLLGHYGGDETHALRKHRAELARAWNRKNIASVLVTKARKRARQAGLPCNITKDDIDVPEFCPVLGIPLKIPDHHTKGGPGNASPTLDRIKPELGYVKGNVMVISWKANRMKNDGTLDELRKLVAWLECLNVEATMAVLNG